MNAMMNQMNSRLRMSQLLLVAILLAVVNVGDALALRVWLSNVGAVGEGVAVTNLQKGFSEPLSDQQLHIWMRPSNPEQNLQGVSLNLRSANAGIINFTGATVFNPVHGELLGRELRRWDSLGDYTISAYPDTLSHLLGNGQNSLNSFPAGIGAAAKEIPDALYDPEADAFLYATVTYDVINRGSTDLYLQIGGVGIIAEGGETSDINVIFGGGFDPPLNANDERNMDSAIADGFIMYAPEPSSLGLAVSCFVAITWLRRRSRDLR